MSTFARRLPPLELVKLPRLSGRRSAGLTLLRNRRRLPSSPANPDNESANVIRMPRMNVKAKPAHKWKHEDLVKFKVDPVHMNAEDFFGCPIENLPMPQFIYPFLQDFATRDILSDERDKATDPTVIDLIHMLTAVSGNYTEPSVIILARAIMFNMGYTLLTGSRDSTASRLLLQYETCFAMGGYRAEARADLALVVAHALGAYTVNIIRAREKALTKALIEDYPEEIINYMENEFFDMVIPVFTFADTQPCFYIVPITASFASAVARGESPPHATQVFYCPAPISISRMGMIPVEERLIILKTFEAFKRLIPTNFAELCRFDSRLNSNIPQPTPSPGFTGAPNVLNKVADMLKESDEVCMKQGFKRSDYHFSFMSYFEHGRTLFDDGTWPEFDEDSI
ncbi:hypothetical protein Clacol_000718 [Clathrus columnatus]|uniref:Uncharacterized protein n=1 Tax=Clathrus columnatus TaxID=1419009 RepID=A0AAV4ZX03_9AGAM|nr:hypothetical protein Clacol_000718 [Clathrus columnatus]